MGSFLDSLLDGARERVDAARAQTTLDELERRVSRRSVRPSFFDALAAPGVRVIAEVKRASPSKGDLAPGIDARTQATMYAEGGAAAISVLTEPDRFKGSLDDLAAVSTLPVPTLRKDFIVDRWQILEAAAAGASAVLLIVAALEPDRLRELHEEATNLGLDVLVEIHDEAELEHALAARPRILGVNARDLRTFDVDRDAFSRLRPQIPDGVLAVAESGIRGPDDVRLAGASGADAVLVGESVVTASDPRAAVAALVEAGAAHQPST